MKKQIGSSIHFQKIERNSNITLKYCPIYSTKKKVVLVHRMQFQHNILAIISVLILIVYLFAQILLCRIENQQSL